LRTRRSKARASANIYWVAPDLSQFEQRILAAKVDAWLDENQDKIPYSVANPGGIVFKDNIWVGTHPAHGLTCATFILELFNELGIPFIDVESWQKRKGDDEWADSILKSIGCMMTSEQVQAQQSLIGRTMRVRPSDIAAAGQLLNQTMEDQLHFDEVNPLAQEFEQALLSS
jgi:hypothetical protein